MVKRKCADDACKCLINVGHSSRLPCCFLWQHIPDNAWHPKWCHFTDPEAVRTRG